MYRRNSDQSYRELERKWQTSGSIEDLLVFNRARAQRGERPIEINICDLDEKQILLYNDYRRAHGEETIFVDLELSEAFKDLGYDDPANMDLDIGHYYWPSEADLLDTIGLNLQGDAEDLRDVNNIPLDVEAVDRLQRAVVWAMESGQQSNMIREAESTLENAFETFSDTEAYYAFWTDEGEQAVEYSIEGVKNAEVCDGRIILETNPDLVHFINACIWGGTPYGVDTEFWEVKPEEYIKSHYHHMKEFWPLYGAYKPQPNYDHTEDFDTEYFAELVRDIEEEFEVQLT